MAALAPNELIALVHENLIYDRDNGRFIWKDKPGPGFATRSGKVAGCVRSDGIRSIPLNGVQYAANRLVWLMEHGELPDAYLHPKDGNRRNCHIDNLMLRNGSRTVYPEKQENYKVPCHDLTLEEFRKLLNYHPETGTFTFNEGYITPNGRKHSLNKRYVGRPIGSLGKNGYYYVGIMGKRYLIHRLVWLFEHGEWPKVIDHIDRDRTNNRITNLRSIGYSGNNLNIDKKKKNILGAKGVRMLPLVRKDGSVRDKPFRSSIHWEGVRYTLGEFATVDEAIECHKNARDRLLAGGSI